jgi:hypothetical protein
MRFVIDLDTLTVIESLTDKRPLIAASSKRGDGASFELIFARSGVAEPLATGAIVSFGLKPKGKYDADAVVFSDDFTLSGTGAAAKYLADPSFNTTPLNALFAIDADENNDPPFIDLMAEITWRTTGGAPTSTQTFPFRVHNDVLRGDEGTPTSLPDPADWMPAALTIPTGDPNVGESLVITGTLTSNGSSSLVFPTLYQSGVASGKVRYTNVASGLGVITHKIEWSTVSAKWRIFNGATVVFESSNNVVSPDLVTIWVAVSPATGTPTVAFDSMVGTTLGQSLQVLDTGAWYKWDGEDWELEAANLTAGPVRSTAGTSSIADGALSIAKTAGLQAALNDKVDDSQISTTGGASKVPQLLSGGTFINGTLKLGATATSGGAAYFGPAGGGICLENLARFRMLNIAGNGGAEIFYHTEHDAFGGELQIDSGNNMALSLGINGHIQLGLQRANSTQYIYSQKRGVATSGTPLITSAPYFHPTEYWTGSASANAKPWYSIGVPDGGGTSSTYRIGQAPSMPVGSGDVETRTDVGIFSADGLTLPTQALSSANSVVTRSLGDTRYKCIHSILSADHAGVASSTALVDSGLSLALVTGVTYEIEMVLKFTCASAGGMKFAGANAGTLAFLGGTVEWNEGGSIAESFYAAGESLDGIVSAYSRTGGTVPLAKTKGVYTATTGGLLRIQVAQHVINAGATVLKQGSYIIARPL